jgi:hypothetical protein
VVSEILCVASVCLHLHYDLMVGTLTFGVSWGTIQHVQSNVVLAYLLDQHHCTDNCLKRSRLCNCKNCRTVELSRRDSTAVISGDEESEGGEIDRVRER